MLGTLFVLGEHVWNTIPFVLHFFLDPRRLLFLHFRKRKEKKGSQWDGYSIVFIGATLIDIH